jgi:hypothetical protein
MVLRVRSIIGAALEVPTRNTRVWPRWVYLSATLLLVLGLYFLIALVVRNLI